MGDFAIDVLTPLRDDDGASTGVPGAARRASSGQHDDLDASAPQAPAARSALVNVDASGNRARRVDVKDKARATRRRAPPNLLET